MKLNVTDYVLPDQDRQQTPPDTDSDMPSSALTSCSSTRPPQSTPGTTPAPSHLPTPRNSSPPPIPLPIADAEASTTGRERRVRKSVNYAEPKLNTCVCYSIILLSDLTVFKQKDAQTGSRDAGETIVFGGLPPCGGGGGARGGCPHDHGTTAQIAPAITCR